MEEVWRIPDGSLLAKESFLLGKCPHKRVRTGEREGTWSPGLKDGGGGRWSGTERTGRSFVYIIARQTTICHSRMEISS